MAEAETPKPRTRAEAVTWILDHLTDEQKALIRSAELDRFLVDCHFGLGLWVRNQIIHGNPHLERLEMDFMKDRRFVHRDEMSVELLEDVWRALRDDSA